MTTKETEQLDAGMISAIVNLVCPNCGGVLIGFRCGGKCRKDWRAGWDSAVANESGVDTRTPKSKGQASAVNRRA